MHNVTTKPHDLLLLDHLQAVMHVLMLLAASLSPVTTINKAKATVGIKLHPHCAITPISCNSIYLTQVLLMVN